MMLVVICYQCHDAGGQQWQTLTNINKKQQSKLHWAKYKEKQKCKQSPLCCQKEIHSLELWYKETKIWKIHNCEQQAATSFRLLSKLSLWFLPLFRGKRMWQPSGQGLTKRSSNSTSGTVMPCQLLCHSWLTDSSPGAYVPGVKYWNTVGENQPLHIRPCGRGDGSVWVGGGVCE